MKDKTRIAFGIFVDIYGNPSFITKPKAGQSQEEVFAVWDKELENYSEIQIKDACYRIVKYKKSMTFPTISHILAELVGEEKEEKKQKDTARVFQQTDCTRWYEEQFLQRKDYLTSHKNSAMTELVTDCWNSLPEEARYTRYPKFADMLKMAWNNGWLPEKLDEYLAKYNKISSQAFDKTDYDKVALYGGAYD